MQRLRQPDHLPRSSWWKLLLFSMIGRRRLRRNFRAVRMAHGERLTGVPPGPLVIYLNHPSWWDPIVCAELARRLLPGRTHRAPISSASLRQYRFLQSLGMFPVEQDSARGAAQFFRAARSVLQLPRGVLWITAQGHFTDVRLRPLELKGGLGKLLERSAGVTVVPLAMEYTFWNQRLPEVLLNVGEPLHVHRTRQHAAADWTAQLQLHLQNAQDDLVQLSLRRNPAEFATLLRGRQGTAGPYGWWQRTRAWLAGKEFSADHLDNRNPEIADAPGGPTVI